jgi:spermidine synthase
LSTSTPITLSEEGGVRYLHFGSPWIQGAMLIDAPSVIAIDYVARMMGWLLFLSPPERILQLGLGAGALTRFVHARMPRTAITVVEHSAEVIATARQWFALPPDGARLRVVRADALAFTERRAERGRYGVIQVDLYDMHARGPTIDSTRFYRACRDALAEPGVCVFNLFGEHPTFEPSLERIRRAFDGRVKVLQPTEAGNRVAFAFRGPPLSVRWPLLRARAGLLHARFGLPAAEWVRELRALSEDGASLVV